MTSSPLSCRKACTCRVAARAGRDLKVRRSAAPTNAAAAAAAAESWNRCDGEGACTFRAVIRSGQRGGRRGVAACCRRNRLIRRSDHQRQLSAGTYRKGATRENDCRHRQQSTTAAAAAVMWRGNEASIAASTSTSAAGAGESPLAPDDGLGAEPTCQ